MSDPPAVPALGQALQLLLREQRTTARAISRELGYHPSYLTRCFHGHRPLRVEVVFAVLEKLGEHPAIFFRSHYPLGGEILPLAKGTSLEALDLDGLPPLADITRRFLARRGTFSPQEYRLRMGEWLQREIRKAPGHSQRSLSRALGLGPTALGQALRGESHLTFSQVFAVLAALGIDPGRLFAALFLPDVESPSERLAREVRLERIETAVRLGQEGFLKRRQRRAAAKAKPKPPQEHEPADDQGPNDRPPTT
jgi:transcriptional regulator with XRE-family HTH domain